MEEPHPKKGYPNGTTTPETGKKKPVQTVLSNPLLLPLLMTSMLCVCLALGLASTWSGGRPRQLALSPYFNTRDAGAPQGKPRRLRFQIEPYQIMGPVHWTELPKTTQKEFTLGGQIMVMEYYYWKSATLSSANPESQGAFNEEKIQEMVESVKNGKNICSYGACKAFTEAFQKFPVEGKSVLVLGSLSPWAEALSLAAGASLVTTVDYHKPPYEHPKIRLWDMDELSTSDELFDAAISYSSFEHDGLGRYADPIHPNADLERMKELRRILKPNGRLFMGVPVGNDTLVFHAHRIYGPIRFPKLIEGWNLLETVGHDLEHIWKTSFRNNFRSQPLNVLEIDHNWVPGLAQRS